MAKILITDSIQAPSAQPERGGKEDVTVFYTVDESSPRSTLLPAEDFTMEKAEAEIRARERELQRTIGREFTV